MQFFLGLEEFSHKPVFDPSLFVHIRKRFGQEAFDRLNQSIIQEVSKERENKAKDKDDQDQGEDNDTPANQGKL